MHTRRWRFFKGRRAQAGKEKRKNMNICFLSWTLLDYVNCWFLSQAATVDKESPWDTWKSPRRVEQTLQTITGHRATHSETQEASAGFLAVALRVVAYSGSLWHPGAGKGSEPRDAPSSEPGARPTPPPPPSITPGTDTSTLLRAGCHPGSAVCQGKSWSPWRKGWLLLGQLLMYLIQHVSKRESLACAAPGLRFAALRKRSPQWKHPRIQCDVTQSVTPRWACVCTPACKPHWGRQHTRFCRTLRAHPSKQDFSPAGGALLFRCTHKIYFGLRSCLDRNGLLEISEKRKQVTDTKRV